MWMWTRGRDRLLRALRPGVQHEGWERTKVHSGSKWLKLTGGAEVLDEEGKENVGVEPSQFQCDEQGGVVACATCIEGMRDEQ